MQLILLSWLLLLARLQIYCNSAILSLPPSLIAGAASFGKHHKRKHQLLRPSGQWQAVRAKEQQLYQTMVAVVPYNERWQMKKDVSDGNVDYIGNYRNWFGNRNSNIISNSYNKNNNNNSNNNYNDNNISQIDNTASMLSHKTSATKYQKKKKRKKSRNTEKHDDVDGDDDGISLQRKQRLQGRQSQKQQQQQQHQQQYQHEWQQHKRNLYKHRHDYEINSLLAAGAAQAQTSETDVMLQQRKEKQYQRATRLQSQSPSPAAIAPRIREIEWNEFFSRMKYWSRLCRSLGDVDCTEKFTDARQEHHRPDHQRCKPGIISSRSKQQEVTKTPLAEIAAIDIHGVTSHSFSPTEASLNVCDNEDYDDNNGGDDDYGNNILSLLAGEDEFRKLLHWTLLHLRSRDLFRNCCDITWNNQKEKVIPLVQLEPALYAEEPRFVIVRRKPDETNILKSSSLHQRDDPFISSRGHKYDSQMTDLSVLFHNSEIFAPNRGKRNNIKDLFKYDDIFIPNRGKKLSKTSLNVRKGLTMHRHKRGIQSQRGASQQQFLRRRSSVRRLLRRRTIVNEKDFFGIQQNIANMDDGVSRTTMCVYSRPLCWHAFAYCSTVRRGTVLAGDC